MVDSILDDVCGIQEEENSRREHLESDGITNSGEGWPPGNQDKPGMSNDDESLERWNVDQSVLPTSQYLSGYSSVLENRLNTSAGVDDQVALGTVLALDLWQTVEGEADPKCVLNAFCTTARVAISSFSSAASSSSVSSVTDVVAFSLSQVIGSLIVDNARSRKLDLDAGDVLAALALGREDTHPCAALYPCPGRIPRLWW